MQLTVTKRMSHHLLFDAFYTFRRNLSNLELENNQTHGDAQNLLALGEEKGRADIDQRTLSPFRRYGNRSFHPGEMGSLSSSLMDGRFLLSCVTTAAYLKPSWTV